jgi:tRNA(Arg) A34 adenosine deaminase TadA
MAIDQAFIAEENGDVPIVALLCTKDGLSASIQSALSSFMIDGPARNHRPDAAAEFIGNWSCTAAPFISPLEPCPMCAGALCLPGSKGWSSEQKPKTVPADRYTISFRTDG